MQMENDSFLPLKYTLQRTEKQTVLIFSHPLHELSRRPHVLEYCREYENETGGEYALLTSKVRKGGRMLCYSYYFN